jgi:hypothetical protein
VWRRSPKDDGQTFADPRTTTTGAAKFRAQHSHENGRRFESRAGRLDNPEWGHCFLHRPSALGFPITCAFITDDWRKASFFDALIFTGSPVCGFAAHAGLALADHDQRTGKKGYSSGFTRGRANAWNGAC